MAPSTPDPGSPSSGAWLHGTPLANDDEEVTLRTRKERAAGRARMLAEEDFDQTGQASSIEYRVKPRTDDDLEVEPPPRQRYPVHLVACMKEMVRSREVLFTFVERDVRVRYKQAVLGGFWAIVQPLMLMVIFTFVFGKIAKIPTGGIPYPIFSYCALVPWQLFAGSVGYATSSIIT